MATIGDILGSEEQEALNAAIQDDAVLSAAKVSKIFMDCLFKEGEDHTGYVRAEGITTTVGFHPGRLEQHRSEVIAMLQELPDDFKRSSGGGMSFLQACMDRNGNQWTGMHQAMEQLFQLGIALGLVTYPLPRRFWDRLPGGMPYVTVDL